MGLQQSELKGLPTKSELVRVLLEGMHQYTLTHFVGVIRYSNGEYAILANPRKTYITPAGQGFLPRETAWHHQNHVVALVRTVLCVYCIYFCFDNSSRCRLVECRR